jgi:uncharacterized protein YodC (DUF2158 family)
MATKFTKGQTVKLVSVAPQGPVVALRMDENGTFFYLVEWTDEAGVKHQRWFEEAQLATA